MENNNASNVSVFNESQMVKNINKEATTSTFLKVAQPIRKTDAEIHETVEKIKNSSFEELVMFGSNDFKIVGSSNSILDETLNKDSGDIENIFNNVIQACQKDYRLNKSFISKIFGAADAKINEIKMHYSSVQQYLNILGEEIVKEREQISLDRARLEESMNEIHQKYYLILDTLTAFNIAKENLEKEFLITEEDKMQSMHFSEGKAFLLELMDKKIADITMRKYTMEITQEQNIREVANLKRVELTYFMIFDTITDLWKNGIAMYLQALRTKKSVGIINGFQKATDKLWVTNAELIAENSLDVFKATSKPMVSIEAADSVNKILLKNISDIKEAYSKSTQERGQIFVRLENLNKNLKKSDNAFRLEQKNVG